MPGPNEITMTVYPDVVSRRAKNYFMQEVNMM